MERRPLVLLSTVASDAHTWNLVYLQLFMQEQGYSVINLGPCVPHAETVRAVATHRPELVVISSINGHGMRQGKELLALLRRALPESRPAIVIGGKLTTSEAERDAARAELLEAQFDAVFQGENSIDEFRAWLPARGRSSSRPVVGEPASLELLSRQRAVSLE